MSSSTASGLMRRALGVASFVGTLIVAGLLFTAALSWWLAAYSVTLYVQKSFAATRSGHLACDCQVQRAWGNDRWITSKGFQATAGQTLVEVPAWVMMPGQTNDLYESDGFGWPMRAVCRHRVFGRSSPTSMITSVDQFDSIDIPPRFGNFLCLPIGPIWPGLIVDTTLWGVLFGAVWFGFLALKRNIAGRRGVCASCGYNRQGLARGAACPECGTAAGGRLSLIP